MNNYEANTSLNLNLSSRKNTNLINLDLVLDPNYNLSPISPPIISPPMSPADQRVFSCNYCRRKFYSSQALGGHQNAHKLERTLAKKSRAELSLSSPVRDRSGSNRAPPVLSYDPFHGPRGSTGRLGRSDSNYGWSVSDEYNSVHQEEHGGQLDLSLRL